MLDTPFFPLLIINKLRYTHPVVARLAHYLSDTNVFRKVCAPFYNALQKAVEQGLLQRITFEGVHYYRVTEGYLRQLLANRTTSIDRTTGVGALASTLLEGVSPDVLRYLLELPTRLLTGKRTTGPDPWRYVLYRTSKGFVTMSATRTLRDYAAEHFSCKPEEVKMREIPGILNAVFVVETPNGAFVAKIFRDWAGWKWPPLSFWTLGIRRWVTRGRLRLANEYRNLLKAQDCGLPVPRVLMVDWYRNLLFESFIEGQNVQELAVRHRLNPSDVTEMFQQAGKLMAEFHHHQIELVDATPKNFIFQPTGSLFVVDLEQATPLSNPLWDIFIFLTYTAFAVKRPDATRVFAEGFLSGYLRSREQELPDTIPDDVLALYSPLLRPGDVEAIQDAVAAVKRS
ncbi:hypothetical protein DRN94_003775 [archaeon]|nr:hypothetical protein [archaeon]